MTFYTSESEWQAAWRAAAGPSARTIAFDTTPQNMGFAMEAPATTGPNTVYSRGELTFGSSYTGLCHDFKVLSYPKNSSIELVYDEGSEPEFEGAISIGQIGVHSNDDFDIWLRLGTGAPVYAFGFYFAHNTAEPGEQLQVGVSQSAAPGYAFISFAQIPDASAGPAFVGVISDTPLLGVHFDEDSGPDELAIKDFRFDDATSIDTDGDGLDDCTEVTRHTDPTRSDTDGDNVSDGDEVAHGTDPLNPDTDGDGLSDGDEIAHHTDPLNVDTDGDGLSDWKEVLAGADPNDSDTDGDGLSDGFEARYGLDPLNPGDAHLDPDGDGLDNLAELAAHTNPRHPDSDGDGLRDGDEVHGYATDPIRADTDGDRLTDGFEIANGFDPLRPGETYQDPDGDGMPNLAEQDHGTNPHDRDTDRDGVSDGSETSRVRSLGFVPQAGTTNLDSGGALPAIAADLDRDGDQDLIHAFQWPGYPYCTVVWNENRFDRPSRDFAQSAGIGQLPSN